MKKILLNSVISICLANSMVFASQNVVDVDEKDQMSVSHFDQLPDEIIQHILSFVKPCTLEEIGSLKEQNDYITDQIMPLTEAYVHSHTNDEITGTNGKPTHQFEEYVQSLCQELLDKNAIFVNNLTSLDKQIDKLSLVSRHWNEMVKIEQIALKNYINALILDAKADQKARKLMIEEYKNQL